MIQLNLHRNNVFKKNAHVLVFYLISVICLFSSLLVAQQTIVEGKIVSMSDNAPIPYVQIIVQPKNDGVYSDEYGNFTYMGLDPGEYELYMMAIGYETFILQNLVIKQPGENINIGVIQLKEKSVQIPEIMVTAYLYNFSNKYISANQVFSQKEFEETRPIGSEEVLKKMVGLTVAGDMGLSNRLNVGIRGSYPRRSAKVLVLEDGTPIAPAPYLAPEMYYNPPSDRLDGIEIIKGTDVLQHGINTMYGAINYITKRPPQKPTMSLNFTGGSHNYRSLFVTYGNTWNTIGGELQILDKHFSGFQENTQSDIFNTTLKIYSDINEKSSFYLKLNYHREVSKATYAALTPLSFRLNPSSNPFDADDLKTKRIAVDAVYNYELLKGLVFSTKLYASGFERFWWRQENTVIKASDIQNYLGHDILRQRYSYLENVTLNDDDYVRVGLMKNGRESSRARNRTFSVLGLQETISFYKELGTLKTTLELGLRSHGEEFLNVEILNDSSRFARSGRLVKDERYLLTANSMYFATKIRWTNIYLMPIMRFEWVEMKRFDLLGISNDPLNNGSVNYGSIQNYFYAFLPGATVGYTFIENENDELTIYGGIYRGFHPPTSEVGFLNVTDGGLVQQNSLSSANMKPEKSINREIGLRGAVLNNLINGQVSFFNNTIQNYYSAGRNEAFQTLGSVRITGIESCLSFELGNILFSNTSHRLILSTSVTLMSSQILSGILNDSELLRAKHTAATKQEFVDKINKERNGYEVYFNGDVLYTDTLNVADFKNIKKINVVFGNHGIKHNRIPYVPEQTYNYSLTYSYKDFTVGVNYNYVSEQYTDYLNFENETAEGAIGKLPAYSTIDASIQYTFAESNSLINGLQIFIVGKNLTNKIYKASRLHRLASGIMPGGFRQINCGISWKL